MSSGHGRTPVAAALATLVLISFAALMPGPAQAMPATVDYRCRPALTGGQTLSIDYSSGGGSITVQFPDGKSVRMNGRAKRYYFFYAGERAKVYGIRQKTVTLTIQGQPTRRCVATSL
jgi:hypothetical protein